MPKLPIDPSKPVGGNFKGTFSGFVAMVVVGSLYKHGVIGKLAAFFCVAEDPAAFLACSDAESYLSILALAGVGSAVNYFVTHYEQVKKLKELWGLLPNTYSEYPEDTTFKK